MNNIYLSEELHTSNHFVGADVFNIWKNTLYNHSLVNYPLIYIDLCLGKYLHVSPTFKLLRDFKYIISDYE